MMPKRTLTTEMVLAIHGAFHDRPFIPNLHALDFALQEIHRDLIDTNSWCLLEVAGIHARHLRRYEVFAEQSGDTALVVALVLLRLNGYLFVCEQDYLYEAVDCPHPSARRIAEALWSAYTRASSAHSVTWFNIPALEIEENICQYQPQLFASLSLEVKNGYTVNPDYGLVRNQVKAHEIDSRHSEMRVVERSGNLEKFRWLASMG